MSMLEALCTRCDEIFVPHSTEPDDLIHGERQYTEGEIGIPCGGIGIIQGAWLLPGGKPPTKEMYDSLAKMEEHGLAAPHCLDPDCEFHHPEVREDRLHYHSDSC